MVQLNKGQIRKLINLQTRISALIDEWGADEEIKQEYLHPTEELENGGVIDNLHGANAMLECILQEQEILV